MSGIDPTWPERMRLRFRCWLVFANHQWRVSGISACGWTPFTCQRCGVEKIR